LSGSIVRTVKCNTGLVTLV